MRIYVLTASGGSGKTATLNTLAQQLCALAPKYVLGAGCNMPPVPPWQSDGRYWFDASTAGKTVRVGICTSGDRPKFIDEAFDYFTNNKTGWLIDWRSFMAPSLSAVGIDPLYFRLAS